MVHNMLLPQLFVLIPLFRFVVNQYFAVSDWRKDGIAARSARHKKGEIMVLQKKSCDNKQIIAFWSVLFCTAVFTCEFQLFPWFTLLFLHGWIKAPSRRPFAYITAQSQILVLFAYFANICSHAPYNSYFFLSVLINKQDGRL